MALRYFKLVIILSLLFACKKKKGCEFESVADFEKLDLMQCKADSMFFYLKKYTLNYNSEREKLGIPLLSESLRLIVYTVNNSVRFADIKAMNDTVNKRPYLHHKDIEWDKDTLKYERTSYTANDTLEQFTGIVYWLDTISAKRDYKYEYYYLNKYYRGDSSLTITKHQSDSILRSWGLSY